MTHTGETTPPVARPGQRDRDQLHPPIPDSERHGTVGQQWRLWYACNANFFCIVSGRSPSCSA